MKSTVLALTAMLVAVSIPTHATLSLTPVGSYETGVFDEGATEITAYDPSTQRLFSVNGFTGAIDVLDLSDPENPTYLFSVDVTPYGAGANHVDVFGGVLAAAVEATVAQDPGRVVFFETAGSVAYSSDVTVGALPDMLTFTSDGTRVIVACEGEPSDDYSVDPEGSVAIVDLSAGVASATVSLATFTAFDADIGSLRAEGVRIFGPGATVAQDLEPEYVVHDPASDIVYAVCQENNALAVIDVASATTLDIVALGFKDHSVAGNGIDASDRDGTINIASWPTLGMYQPDGMAGYTTGGDFYIVTANEGDARDYDTFSEEARVEDVTLDPTAYPDAATLQLENNLGRLDLTLADGDTDGDGDYDQIYSYGARSFSIWDANGDLVFDSGEMLEQTIADLLPLDFNSDNDENNSFDSRSDAKGPEPEGVAVTEVDGRWYALIGMERVGGLFRFDVTDPSAPFFVEYVNTRDFSGDLAAGTAGNSGPEGITVIPRIDSPVGQTLVVVSYEVSGSIGVFLLEEETVAITDPAVDEAPASRGSRALKVYPNPFNPITNVSFSLERDTHVALDVVDARGRRVATLVDGMTTAGDHTITWSATDVPSGVYFARLVTGERVHVQRVTLLK